MQIQTTFVSHEPKSINGRNGQYTLHIFRTADGTQFQTSKADIANKAYGIAFADGVATGKTLTVAYEQKQNGNYTNNVIQQVEEGAVTLAAAPGAPTGGAPTGGAPTGSSSGAAGGSQFMKKRDPDEAKQIMRQSAVTAAFTAIQSGLVEVGKLGEVIVLAEKFVKYFEGGPAALVQAAGSGQAQQAAAPADGGGAQQAAAEAPVSAAPASSVVAGDDIPF